MKKLYKSKWILPANPKIVIENGIISIENNVITGIFNQEDIISNGFEVIDFGNSVITPGFINLHAHLQYTDIKKKNQKSFTDWIINLVKQYFFWSKQKKLNSFRNGLNQAIKSGTTCIAQLSSEEMFFEELKSSPIKSYIFFEIFSDSPKAAEKNFNQFREKYERLLPDRTENIFLGISPHSFYNVHKDLWEKISEYCNKNNILIHTHFAESIEEMQWLKTGVSDINNLHKFLLCKQLKPFKIGLTPVKYLKELNLPYENLIAAHANQLETQDFSELAKLGVSLAHCPRSNMFLHNKTFHIREVLKHFPHKIGLGTDGLCSNYDLNILNEAKFIFDAGVELFTVLEMLTINSASILRLDNTIGSLEAGKHADFLVFKLKDGEFYEDFIRKERPDFVYISGKQINHK